ncbi:MAG: MATE family efflux transporter, partial [Anaerovoracaceae bacterium]
MNQTYMKDNSIFPLVLTMSLPMIISMLVNAMYNIVDSYFVAQISGNAMTALSLVFPLQNLVNSVAIGFGIGINAAVAFFLGAEKREAANASVRKGLILSGLHGILLTGICIFGASRFISLFTTNSEILTYSLDYSYIVFAFSPIVTLGVSLEKIFQSVGRMKISMLSMLCGCIINIILDPIFIFGLGFVPEMGIKGAALATGIGQLSTLALYIYFFKKIPLPIQLVKTPPASTYHDRSEYKTGDIYRRLYLVGVPATLNLALPSLLITALNGILVEFSQIYVLILGIYYKLQTFIYFTASGIVQVIRPLYGDNYGAGTPDRVLKSLRISLA